MKVRMAVRRRRPVCGRSGKMAVALLGKLEINLVDVFSE